MKKLVRDRAFYKTFFSMVIIIALQQIITLAVNLADNVMLGRYSELALSGAAIANQIFYMVQMILSGIGAGLVALNSQYWGKGGDLTPIRRITSVGIKFAILIGVLCFAAIAIWPHGAMRLLTNEEDVIRAGIEYLGIIKYTFILFCISNAILMALRGVETTAIGTIISVITLFTNIGLNYCLIFGKFGAPELGIVGAAIATLISRAVELIVSVVYVCVFHKKLLFRLKDLFGIDMFYAKDFIKVSTPVILSGIFWGLAQCIQTGILGRMGESAIAANSIASVIFELIAVSAFSAASVEAIMVGKIVGEGKTELVRPYAYTMQLMNLVIGLVLGGLLFITKDLFISFYAITGETQEIAHKFLTILSVTLVGSAYEFPTGGGIIQGGGDTKYISIIDTVFTWCYALPLSALALLVWHLSPVETFMILKSDQIIKCVPAFIRCNRFKWVKVLVREDVQ